MNFLATALQLRVKGGDHQRGKVNSGTTWPTAIHSKWAMNILTTYSVLLNRSRGWAGHMLLPLGPRRPEAGGRSCPTAHPIAPARSILSWAPDRLPSQHWPPGPFLPTVVIPALTRRLTMAPRTGRGPDAQESPGPSRTYPHHSTAVIHSTPRERRSSGSAGSSAWAGQEVPPLCWTPATPRHAEVRLRKTSFIATSVSARLEAGGGADLESARGRRRRSTGR